MDIGHAYMFTKSNGNGKLENPDALNTYAVYTITYFIHLSIVTITR